MPGQFIVDADDAVLGQRRDMADQMETSAEMRG